MPGKCRPSLMAKTLDNVMRSNLSKTDKACIKAVFERFVDVVRCRDCKHNVANWDHDELDVTDYTDITCDFFMTDGMEPDDFCSHGERRADNATD